MNEREIFVEAMQKGDPAERQAFLDVACGGDAALRRRIEDLVTEEAKLGSFLESPPVGVAVEETLDLPQSERLGNTIGPYKLLQQLGEGGMGAVFMAEQTAPVVRRVALKIIKPGMDTRQVIARFEAERQALALMDHPNIAKVLDAGATATGRPFFVMELVKGVPITKYCDQQHLSPHQRLELFLPVCQAVQHAHQKGIIHRDLKPSNVLVALYDGVPVPKVIDFGVAKATNQRLTDKTMFTEVGSIVGTLEYMAPEQAEVNNLDIDTRADIYSLGVLLYELLTGSPPFSARQLRNAAFDEMLRIIREEEPPRPSTKLSSSNELPSIAANRHLEPARLRRLVQGDLDWIVMKCLEKQRQRRYDTANGLALDLERYLQDEPVLAGPPSASYRLQKFFRRHRAPVLVAATILVLLMAGIAASTWQAIRATNAEGVAKFEAEQKEQARELAVKNENTANQAALSEAKLRRQIQRHLYVADMNRVQHAWDESNIGRARELLNRYRPSATSDDLRSFEWFHFWQKCHPNVLTVEAESPLHGLALAAKGSMLATAHSDRLTRLWNRNTRKQIATLKGHDQDVLCVALTTNGQLLASGSDDFLVKIWNTETEKLIADCIGHNARVYALSISPDDKVVASASFDGSLKLWDLENEMGALKASFSCGDALSSVAFSPDGQLLAIGTCNAGVQIRKRDSGEILFGLPAKGGIYGTVAFSPNGQWIAEGSIGVRLWDFRNRKLIAMLPHERHIQAIAFSPDGSKLATGGYDRVVRLWSIPEGRLLCIFKDHSDWIATLAFSTDGRVLASASEDGTAKLWNIDEEFASDLLMAEGGGVRSLAYAPDGKWFASATYAGVVELWRANSGKKTRTIKHGQTLNAVAISPDGKQIATATVSGGEVKLWNAETGDEIAILKSAEKPTRGGRAPSHFLNIAYAPNGEILAAPGLGDSILLWDVARHTQIGALAGDGGFVNAVAFSPNGDTLVSGSDDGTLVLWDVATKQSRKRIAAAHIRNIWCVAFSPNGEILASSSKDHTIKLWDAATGEPISTMKGHPDQVNSLAFSPDGVTLASASVDFSVKLWDVASADEKATLNGHTNVVRTLVFSPDGDCLVSGGYDGTVRLWRSAASTTSD